MQWSNTTRIDLLDAIYDSKIKLYNQKDIRLMSREQLMQLIRLLSVDKKNKIIELIDKNKGGEVWND